MANVLKGIRRLMGSTIADAGTQEAFQQLNTVAPLKTTKDTVAGQEESSFVCREAILDRKEHIAGYVFALGRALQSRMLEQSALIRKVYDDAMLRNLVPLAVPALLGKRIAFIRLSATSLTNPLLTTFSTLNTVIMITPGQIAENELDEVRSNLQHLKKLGIKHGWTIDRRRPELAEFLNKAEFIEIESTVLDGIQLRTMAADFRAGNAKLKLIASELQTYDDFNLCYQSGYDYFMGPFVSSRENWHPPKSDINRLRVFEALNMLRAGEEFNAIADKLRMDPILTFKLLRYINSPGIGLQQKISEISQALLLMGRDRFYRWLSLLLFDFNKAGYHELILNEQALTRARFMETLAGKGEVPALADQLFLTGLFSLLDVMLDRPLIDVLKQVSLPEVVSAALKGEDSILRDALLLGIAIESASPDEMDAAAEKCGLDVMTVTKLTIEALSWSQKVLSATD